MLIVFMILILLFCTDGIDFMRDVIALMCVVGGIIAVAFDGKVSYQNIVLFTVAVQ